VKVGILRRLQSRRWFLVKRVASCRNRSLCFIFAKQIVDVSIIVAEIATEPA